MKGHVQKFIQECDVYLLSPLPILSHLHGMPESIVCDHDLVFTIKFNFSSTYHPQTDGQTEMCFTSSKLKECIHSSTKETPFEIVYGREPPTLLAYVHGTSRVESIDKFLLERNVVIKDVKANLKIVQERMRKYYDEKHTDRCFQVGKFVYLKLRPYRQLSLAQRKNLKPSPKFFGPFKILSKIGTSAYKLELSPESKLHTVFHISLLKKRIGDQEKISPTLPELPVEEALHPLPQAILETRKKGREIEALVHWKNLSPTEATWENLA
ncbi:hypothetical protein I3760_11G159400 [Carya illinoinensis]|nr:hypothetical protein I3760_11G159400 [Carya illinoinensis]